MMDVIAMRIAGALPGPGSVARPPFAVEAFETHRLELERFLTGITRSPEEAAEITQESFLRLVREEQAGRAPDNVRAWLYRVGQNLATSRARHRTVADRHAAALRWQAADSGESPEDGAIRHDDERRVLAALANLSLDARTALVLAAEGYTGREIAERIGRSEAATRTLLCRARIRVRELVEAADTADRLQSELKVRVLRGRVAANFGG